jgi:glycosyltransferase involved in cell wall biosynthesis
MNPFTGRVIHLASGDLWGGAEALIFSLAREQERLRPGTVRCIVMNPGPLAEKLAACGVSTQVLDESRQSFVGLLSAVRKDVAQFAPRVVHSHRQKENLLAWLAGRASRIASVHGLPEPIHGASSWRRGLVQAVNGVSVRFGFDAVVGVSRDVTAIMRSRLPSARVVCVHNGVEVSRNAPPSVPHSGPLRLVALGRLVPIKHFERLGPLSDALAITPRSRPAIVLAGDGPLDQELRSALRPDDPKRQIEMPGFIADVAALLAEADALVITSDHEGIPMAVLEALAAGVPVFGFAVGGLPEICGPGVPLQLAPAADVAALAGEIVTFFNKYPPGVRLPPPHDWAFDIRQCAAAYDRIYATL